MKPDSMRTLALSAMLGAAALSVASVNVSGVYGVRKVSHQLAVDDAAPATAGPATLQQDLDRLIAGRVIRFASGSDVIVEDGRALLDQLVPVLARNSRLSIDICGYTDGAGDPSANQDLGRRRADAVKSYLVSRGVNANLLTAVGYGSSGLVADNESATGRQANRRIVFRVREEK